MQGRRPHVRKRSYPQTSVPSSPDHLRLKTSRKLALHGLLHKRPPHGSLSETEHRMLQHELAIARELQTHLLPRRIPPLPGYDLNAYYRPCREVGGDYYDFIPLDDDHVGILVADVAGKGIAASIVMTETRALMRSEAVRTLSPAETLLRVNRILHEDLKRGLFVSMCYGILTPSTGILRVTSAGHPPMILWRQATQSHLRIHPNGMALGIDGGSLFEKTLREQIVPLAPGDRFVLYTDGVIETMNLRRQPFGWERFQKTICRGAAKSSGEFISILLAELDSFQGSALGHDDMTLVTGRRLSVSRDRNDVFIS